MSQFHVKLLERASEILGGPEELASYLGVSHAKLRIWNRGIIPLPDAMFLKLVDLIDTTGDSAVVSGRIHNKPSVEKT